MTLPERQCVAEVGLERMREIETCARPLQARLSVVEVRIEALDSRGRVSAIVGEDFAKRIAGLEIQAAAEAPADFNTPGVIRRAGIVAQKVRRFKKCIGCEL